jgi:hypothetical protein
VICGLLQVGGRETQWKILPLVVVEVVVWEWVV